MTLGPSAHAKNEDVDVVWAQMQYQVVGVAKTRGGYENLIHKPMTPLHVLSVRTDA